MAATRSGSRAPLLTAGAAESGTILDQKDLLSGPCKGHGKQGFRGFTACNQYVNV